jgi:glyoxylase-like metal-dependent hydrolase (beta-lactamase superfamily II)
MTASLSVRSFFDPATWTVTHVAWDASTKRAAVIDPVLDFDVKSGRTATSSADRVLAFLKQQGLALDWILETHAHADHLSAAQHIRHQAGGRVAIGSHISAVQKVFKTLFNLEAGFATDGSQFDHLFREGETFRIGNIEATAMHVPGHTPADMAYLAGDAVFVGDTLFMPDVGTARADFPGGDAHQLYRSIRRILALPEATRVFVCHDYPPAGREAAWESTVAAERRANIHAHDGVDEAAFVAMRTTRDATLEVPNLILPSIQINVRAGAMPPSDGNGISYLRLPLNALGA